MNESHETSHPLIATAICSDLTPNTIMNNMFDSLSKKGKKLRDRLRGKRRRPGGTEANTPGESATSSGSFFRPDPHVAAGDHDGEGNRTSTDVRPDGSRDQSPQPPQPGPIVAGGGGGVMSTVSQGASGSTAHTGLRPAPGQPVMGGNRPTQISPEQSMSREIKRLIVRLC